MAHHQPSSSAQTDQGETITPTAEIDTVQPAISLHQSDVAQALTSGDIAITISELLGCDYVFLKHPSETLLMHTRHITSTLNKLISILDLTPGQKIFINTHETEHGDVHFARLTCDWQGATATRVTSTAVTDSEQIDFMRMIFDCSSPYESDLL